jgi:hypothetical protein
MRARAAAHLDALSAVADAVSDVAAMHAATNHRVSGLSVSGPVSADKAARLTVVSALLSDHPDATTQHALSALADAGHTVTDRTARRLLADARTTDTRAADGALTAGA